MRRLLLIAVPLLLGLALSLPILADDAVSDAAIIATNSARVDKNSDITGDVVVNDAAGGPTIAPGFELQVDRGSLIDGDVRADSLNLHASVVVTGDVECNDGNVGCSGLTLPVFADLPPFRPATPGSGAGLNCMADGDCDVAAGATVVLDPGAYRNVTIGFGGTLVLSGGYDVASVVAGEAAAIEAAGPTELRVVGPFDMRQKNTYVGPAGGCSSGRDLVLYIGLPPVGEEEGAGPLADPLIDPLAVLGRDGTFCANFYVEAGTLQVGRNAAFTGQAIATDVKFNQGATVVLDSAFNPPPTADAQTVFTGGVDPIVITLTGSDPEGDSLTFSIVAGPTAGTITSGPTPVTSTSAVVTYDAASEGAPDAFTFGVNDGKGGSDTAVVDINPVDDPPPPLDEIVASDDEFEVVLGSGPVDIVLNAAAPETMGDLVFSILSGPTLGTIESGPTSSTEDPVRSATISYQVGGIAGIDTITFNACEVAAPTNCDTATLTIGIAATAPPPPPLAENQSVETQVDTNVPIDLAGSGSSEVPPDGRVCTEDSDCDAGFICVDGACELP